VSARQTIRATSRRAGAGYVSRGTFGDWELRLGKDSSGKA